MFFISAVPSEIRRFKFKVSWLCDAHIAADTFVVEGSRERAITAPLGAVDGLNFAQIGVVLIASRKSVGDSRRESVGDSRIRTAIGPRSRWACQMFNLSFFQ
jgi:hypothetical protein